MEQVENFEEYSGTDGVRDEVLDIILGGVRRGIDFRGKCRRKPWNIKSTEIR